jgi:hypothetical protein
MDTGVVEMISAEFVQRIEDYYGKYGSDVVRLMILSWVEKQDVNLDRLFEITIEQFSTRWGKAPGIADIKEIYESDEELKRSARLYTDSDGEVWSRGYLIGYYQEGDRFNPHFVWGVPKGWRKMIPENISPKMFLEKYANEHIEKELLALAAPDRKRLSDGN